MSTRPWPICVIVVASALALLGCQSMTGRSLGQHVNDKAITTQVKTKLATDSFVNLFSTDVGTHFGVVHLGGTVATPQDRAEAERIASRVEGVKRVVNDIVVVPREGQAAVTPGAPRQSASPGPTTGSTR